jgi:hypothetical protein
MKGQDEVRAFLTQLFKDEDQFEIFTIIDDKSVSPRYPKETPSSLSTIDYDKLSQMTGYAIYFTPNSMKKGKRSKATVDKFNTMFLDFDFKDHIEEGKVDTISTLEGLQLPPSAMVETKNGIHAYWFLQEGTITDFETYEALQRAMQQKLGSDQRAVDCSHLMRLPGFRHWKDPNDPFDVKIISKHYDKRYTLDELTHKFGGKKKLKALRKKHQVGAYSNKPIAPATFSGQGNIENIATQCQAFHDIESRKDLGHHERLALVWVYSNLGQAGIDHLMEVLENQNDYDEDVSTSFINHSITKGYKPPTCKWMQDNGLCNGKCVNIGSYNSPIGLFYDKTPELPDLNKNKNFLSTFQYFNVSLPGNADTNIKNRVDLAFSQRGQSLSHTHVTEILYTARVMGAPLYNDKPIVISIAPGLGKTTLIEEYVRYMLQTDPDFGAIIVVERQDTIQDIVNRINKGFAEKKAYPMLGYSASDCQKKYPTYKPSQCKTCDVSYLNCRVKYNFIKQERCPVVVISHKRLFDMSDTNDALYALRRWTEPDSANEFAISFGPMHKRSKLFIDERPSLVNNTPTNSTMIDTLLTDVQQYTPKFYPEVVSGMNLLRPYYSLPSDYEQVDVICSGFNWSSKFKEAWRADYLGDYPEYPDLFGTILAEGGLYSKSDHTITTTHYSNIYWQDFSTYVFDGTGNLDPEYRTDLFYYFNPGHIRDYEHLTFNVCMENNLSKTFYQNNTDFIKRFSSDISGIASNDKTYVVCYKDNEDEYRKHLGRNPNISIEHYGNTKGANHLMDNVNIVCTGVLNKGEPHYISKHMAIMGQVGDFHSSTSGKVRRYDDPKIESVKILDMVTDLIQEIFRTKLRNHYSDQDINVYLVSRDKNLIKALVDAFPGCQVNRNWMPKALVNDREAFREFVDQHGSEYSAKTKLVKAFIDQGYILTSDDLMDVLDIDSKHASRYLK